MVSFPRFVRLYKPKKKYFKGRYFKKNYKNSNYKGRNRFQKNNRKFIKRKKKIIPWIARILQKKNRDKKRYYGFFLRRKCNIFITITNVRGEVIVSRSAGSCKIKTKKRKSLEIL